MSFFNFTSAAPKKLIFLQIHSLNLRKEENLCFDNILFVNDWSVINKISPVSPNHVFSKWKGRGGNVYFEQSLYEKKSELIIFFLIIAYVRGKAPWKVNLNGNSDDWNLIFNAADRMGQWEIKI